MRPAGRYCRAPILMSPDINRPFWPFPRHSSRGLMSGWGETWLAWVWDGSCPNSYAEAPKPSHAQTKDGGHKLDITPKTRYARPLVRRPLAGCCSPVLAFPAPYWGKALSAQSVCGVCARTTYMLFRSSQDTRPLPLNCLPSIMHMLWTHLGEARHHEGRESADEPFPVGPFAAACRPFPDGAHGVTGARIQVDFGRAVIRKADRPHLLSRLAILVVPLSLQSKLRSIALQVEQLATCQR